LKNLLAILLNILLKIKRTINKNQQGLKKKKKKKKKKKGLKKKKKKH